MSTINRDDITLAIGDNISVAISNALCSSFGERVEAIQIEKMDKRPNVADASENFRIKASNKKLFLKLSNSEFPNVVDEEVQQSRKCKDYLGCEVGSVILTPVLSGEINGRSYAVFDYCEGFGGNRIIWWYQKQKLMPSIFSWLRAVLLHPVSKQQSDTRTSNGIEHAIDSLRRLHGLPDWFSAEMSGARFSGALSKGCNTRSLMHGDLWKGNILRSPAHCNGMNFVIVDWRGAHIDGFPFFDLICLCRSLRVSRSTARTELDKHRMLIGCGMFEARLYIIGGLGLIARNIDQFPLTAFWDLARETLNYIDSLAAFDV